MVSKTSAPVDDKPDQVTGAMGWGKFLQNFGIVSFVVVAVVCVYFDFRASQIEQRDTLLKILDKAETRERDHLINNGAKIGALTGEISGLRKDFRDSVTALADTMRTLAGVNREIKKATEAIQKSETDR